jgi:GxxExxY protein
VRAEDVNRVTGSVVDAAMRVHTALGPGLLESVYEVCLAYELRERGLKVLQQVTLPVIYKGLTVEAGYRIDLLVNDLVVVELKAVEKLAAVFEAQLLSYLKLSGMPAGLLINFNVVHLRYGIKRLVNGSVLGP